MEWIFTRIKNAMSLNLENLVDLILGKCSNASRYQRRSESEFLTILQELFKGSIYESNRGDKIQCAGLLYKWHFAERFEIFKSSLIYHNNHFLKVFKIDWLKLIDQNHFLLFYQCKQFILLSKSGLKTCAFTHTYRYDRQSDESA